MTAREFTGRFGLDRLSPRDRRAVRLGLLVAVPIVLWAGVVRPYRQAWSGARDRLEAERALLAREQSLLTGAASLPDALREAGVQAENARRRMVEAASPAVAEGELTAELERLAAQSRVLLQEMRSIEPPRASAPPAGLVPIRLAMRGESDLNGFATFLRRVEENSLLLRIVEVSIQPVLERPVGGQRGRGQEPAAPAVPTGVIEFAVMVEAYTASAARTGDAVPEEAGT